MQADIFVAPVEFKFASDSATGEFEGYGAVFGNIDAHGDLIMPGAFLDSIADKKAKGRTLPMHVMHARHGDGLPVGVWKGMEEDSKGLHVSGKISGMNTDAGRLLYERVKDGALGGLSIGFRPKKEATVYGRNPGEPRRTLKAVDLKEISLVAEPSNALALVHEIKSALTIDTDKAAKSLAAAMRLHDRSMGESYSYASPRDKALLMDHLRDAHHALTGERAPDGLDGWTKSIPEVLRQLGWTDEEIVQRAGHDLKSLLHSGGDQANDAAARAALGDLGATFSGFSLPKF